jgi:hypothetical protein
LEFLLEMLLAAPEMLLAGVVPELVLLLVDVV